MQRPETGRLLEALPYGKTMLDKIWMILSEVATVPPGEQRTLLRSMLDAIKDAEFIEFPRMTTSWDRSALPHLPKWINRPRTKVVRQYAEHVIWSPELSFLSSKKELADSPWLKIDKWLKETRNFIRDSVPVRERSLEIFGDEKMLDALIGAQAFKSSLITLDALSCYYVPEPAAWERGPLGSEKLPGVCIENSTTYDVVKRFNREAGIWGFVVYGRGNGFASVVEGILPIMEEFGHSRILYFGDADHEGLEIAARGARKFSAAGRELELEVRLYRLILECGKFAESKTGGVLSPGATDLIRKADLNELPGIFLQHLRVSQEWAGYRRLKRY
ncbi:DUF2220 family protein [Geotalea uraniireducens]|uniref:Wadjet protein JetD C-terminal domain-containing protein n=1 Tax=Geotalea uraniireducens (strain Rf4) TaxID=351605 RepID=A5GB24_GEOUR|nr:DUF2220 family protein [Geotalea uraniireducens]ABQ25218.1 hypothetical protein Gura_1012 [Geotalea uraniireducens Rf4]